LGIYNTTIEKYLENCTVPQVTEMKDMLVLAMNNNDKKAYLPTKEILMNRRWCNWDENIWSKRLVHA